MKPHWQSLHDWWRSDFIFWLDQRWFFIKLLRKRPGDERYIKLIKSVDKAIKNCQAQYKKLYGCNMNLRDMRKEIEQ